MRKGKYLKPKVRRKMPAILIASLAVLLVMLAGGTLAYLQTASGQVTNTFAPAEVKITVLENKTEATKEDITFQNDGTVPVYIRATTVIYWTDTIDGTQQVIAMPGDAAISGEYILNNGWFQVGDIYYYAQPVAPGTSTAVMLSPITVTVPEGSTAQCHIDIRAEAIQAVPSSAVEAAWTAVKVEGGSLTIK